MYYSTHCSRRNKTVGLIVGPVDGAVILLDGGDEDGRRFPSFVIVLSELELNGTHEEVTLVVAHVDSLPLVDLHSKHSFS